MSVTPDSTKALYEEFYERFQASRSELSAQLRRLNTEDFTDSAQDIIQEVAKLRKSLVDGTDLLPSYDKRQCESQMAELEKMVEGLRPSAVMKPKFAFKRRASAKPSAFQHERPSPSPAAELARDPSTFLTLSARSRAFLSQSSLPPSAASQSDLTIADLDHCILDLCTCMNCDGGTNINMDTLVLTALHIRNLHDCVVLLPSVQGSVLVHDLTRCVLLFRMHTSTDVDVYLAVPSNPVIEHCSNIRFASYPSLVLSPTAAALLPATSKHECVQDFSHIRSTPSSHWEVLRSSKTETDWAVFLKRARNDTDAALREFLPC
ncbi:tubulin binding cofactor C-domain-containing protein [Vararia minispora EC-137]|uniref:Tubulin binding cofactor C-domain-containing protein n=1 Tax=Vararia minispora EC-137 TaxID=1314806 RepID=A0ACB8QZW1_9AGAM|nr:tubulin binding cofactor C-domain-containing protein [Vararia minispora EC-137]